MEGSKPFQLLSIEDVEYLYETAVTTGEDDRQKSKKRNIETMCFGYRDINGGGGQILKKVTANKRTFGKPNSANSTSGSNTKLNN